nr:immunoglobulin heavy chain junction region [Mus musculus]
CARRLLGYFDYW